MRNRTLTVKTVKTLDVNDIGGELWSGARDRWIDADDDTREAVFDRICDWTDGDEEVDMTTVNDLIWFECDDLFFPEEDDSDSDDEDDSDSDEEDDSDSNDEDDEDSDEDSDEDDEEDDSEDEDSDEDSDEEEMK